MLETALVVSTLLGMVLFILDMGRMLLWQQFFMERARQGARSAVVNNWDQTALRNFVCYNSTTAPDGNPPGFLGLLPSQVTLTKQGDSGANDARYKVGIQGVTLFLWIPGIAGRYTMPPVIATMPVESAGATN